MTLAEHLLARIARDPHLAYYFDPLTTSMELLTAEYAAQKGISVEEFRGTYYGKLKFEDPGRRGTVVCDPDPKQDRCKNTYVEQTVLLGMEQDRDAAQRKAAALDKLEVLMRDKDLNLWSTPIDFGVSGYGSRLQGNGPTLLEAIEDAKERP